MVVEDKARAGLGLSDGVFHNCQSTLDVSYVL